VAIGSRLSLKPHEGATLPVYCGWESERSKATTYQAKAQRHPLASKSKMLYIKAMLHCMLMWQALSVHQWTADNRVVYLCGGVSRFLPCLLFMPTLCCRHVNHYSLNGLPESLQLTIKGNRICIRTLLM